MEEKRDQVPYCSGRNFPKVTVPQNACDCHHHIYDPVHFAYQPTDVRNQPPATVDVYRMLQRKLGLTRNVIVQPSAYGTDNRCTLAALKEMGKQKTRAIVVVDATITERELKDYDDLGVRGVRFNINCGYDGNWTKIQEICEKIAAFHWCACFWMPADLLWDARDVIENLPCTVVLDHRGHLPSNMGMRHSAFSLICDWLKSGKVYVKLSGLYIDTVTPDYSDTMKIGKAFTKMNSNQILWGTDWPHPSCYSKLRPMPDDAYMLDCLMDQAGTEENFRKILVDNPAKLFGF
ncbi:MAG: amidohydrolase family protein [Acidaminococcus sp.]|jgi:predicted TIM-barrel fold metal-dependent hydrolase|nr:amidohydrolase family protein [Acidaminococcus sp.]MCI2115118.1 amidohydrolase family protein [Acidaminococcus sp.]MCI2117194.1 amidohydrolase family protein [Acidaminococcus sp.]